MRHNVFGKKLNRDIKQRQALFKSLTKSLVKYGKIETTYPKAKAVRGLIEKMVTKAKKGDANSKRHLESFLVEKDLVDKMMNTIGPVFKSRNGGYLRIIKLGKRIGDTGESVRMEWTDEIKSEKTEEKPKKAKEVKDGVKKEEKVEKEVKTKKPRKVKSKTE
jgi:large subunit ribosomal protein L17